MCVGEYTQVIWDYFLYKELEPLWILISTGCSRTNSSRIPRDDTKYIAFYFIVVSDFSK